MKAIPLPTQARLKELLDYNEETGEFRWKKKSSITCNYKIGDIAGKRSRYIQIKVDKITYQAHRLAWMYMTGEDPGELDIDHDDNNKHNNAFINLRKATNGQNKMNAKTRKNNKLGIKGVYKVKNKYWASIMVEGKKIRMGSYNTADEAHKAYCDAADKYHGEYANHG